jgi:hypothetical protein
MFSGGDYHEVARWLRMFLNSHAKREHPRVEAIVDAEGERENKSYGTWLRLAEHVTPEVAFDFKDVADHRGSLAWCQALADATRARVRDLLAAAPAGAAAR